MSAPGYGTLHGLLYIPDDAESIARTPEGALTNARAVQRIIRLMLLGMQTPDETWDADEELLIHLSWFAAAWALRASELLAAERAQASPDPLA